MDPKLENDYKGENYHDGSKSSDDEYEYDNSDNYSNLESSTFEKMESMLNYASHLYEELLHESETNTQYLSFNGNVDLAKKIAEKQTNKMSILNDLVDNADEENVCQPEKTVNNSINNNSFILTPHFTHPYNFLVSINDINKAYVLQLPREPRTKFLLRFPSMLQECLNTGNLIKLKYLFDDTLTEKCIFDMITSPPFMGREKIYETFCSILRTSPDYYILLYDVKKVSKRVLSVRGNGFGTIPYVGFQESRANFYNFLGSNSDHLDENQRIQKQKYELLKSQGKVIKIERKATWYIYLNKEANQISKIIAKTASVEFFDACQVYI